MPERLNTPINDPEDKDELDNVITEEEAIGESVDNILRKIGACGPSNILILIGCMILNFGISPQTLLMYFAANDPPWKCVNSSRNAFCEHSRGKIFEATDDDFQKRCSFNRSDWEYTTNSKYSIVTEFDLVCGKDSLAALANSALFIGWGIGGVFTGLICDMVGRKLTLTASFLMTTLLSLACCFITAIWQLVLLRTFLGISTGTVMAVQYILLSELTAPENRSLQVNTFGLAFTLSLSALTGIAYYIREWRHLVMFVTIPVLVGLIMTIVLPESPRWLYTKGKLVKSERILKKMGRLNNRDSTGYKLKPTIKSNVKDKTYSYLDMFRTWSITMFVLAQAVGWFTNGLVYYALSLEAADLGGDIYTNFVMVAFADVPGNILAIYICNRFGRKKSTLLSFLIGGLLLGCIAPIPKSYSHGHIIRIVLALIGKCCIDISFSGFYIWTLELYPTVVRTQGMTICQISCRVGSASAPFIVNVLRNVWPPLPFIIMCGASILAALMGLILPETSGKATREKYEDIYTKPANISLLKDESRPLMSDTDELPVVA